MNDKKKILIAAVVLLVIVGVVIGVMMSGGGRKGGDIELGAVVFLTGPQAALGQEVKGGLDLAADQINQGGGINGRKVKLVYEDSKDEAKEAISAFRRLTDRGIPAIVVTGDVVSLQLSPFAAEKKLPMVAIVAAGPDIPKKDTVFRVWLQATRQGDLMGQYAGATLRLKSVSGLRINNEFGDASFGAFRSAFEKTGGKVAAVETFGVVDRDVRNQITKIKASNPQAIFLTGFGDGYGACVKQLRESGYTGILLTDATLSIPFFTQQTMPANEGAYVVTTVYDEHSTEPKAVDFSKRWRDKYNSTPSFVGAFAYDSLQLLAESMRKNGASSEQIRQGLQGIEGLDGAVGRMRFLDSGELQFPLVIKKVQGGKLAIVDAGGKTGG
jgi:branched-chain amino acid transport system substrate-binding protein